MPDLLKSPIDFPRNCSKTGVGAVTIDNQDYLRYMGKSKFVSESPAADDKVMSLRQVIEERSPPPPPPPCSQQIKAGMRFKNRKR